MKLLMVGQVYEIDVVDEMTLTEALATIGKSFDSESVYRSASAPLGERDHVTQDDVVVVARPEDNGHVL